MHLESTWCPHHVCSGCFYIPTTHLAYLDSSNTHLESRCPDLSTPGIPNYRKTMKAVRCKHDTPEPSWSEPRWHTWFTCWWARTMSTTRAPPVTVRRSKVHWSPSSSLCSHNKRYQWLQTHGGPPKPSGILGNVVLNEQNQTQLPVSLSR